MFKPLKRETVHLFIVVVVVFTVAVLFQKRFAYHWSNVTRATDADNQGAAVLLLAVFVFFFGVQPQRPRDDAAAAAPILARLCRFTLRVVAVLLSVEISTASLAAFAENESLASSEASLCFLFRLLCICCLSAYYALIYLLAEEIEASRAEKELSTSPHPEIRGLTPSGDGSRLSISQDATNEPDPSVTASPHRRNDKTVPRSKLSLSHWTLFFVVVIFFLRLFLSARCLALPHPRNFVAVMALPLSVTAAVVDGWAWLGRASSPLRRHLSFLAGVFLFYQVEVFVCLVPRTFESEAEASWFAASLAFMALICGVNVAAARKGEEEEEEDDKDGVEDEKSEDEKSEKPNDVKYVTVL